MEFSIQLGQEEHLASNCLIIGITQINEAHHQDQQLSALKDLLPVKTIALLNTLIERKQLLGKAKQCDLLYQPDGLEQDYLAIVGLGNPDKITRSTISESLAVMLKALNKRSISSAEIDLQQILGNSELNPAEVVKSLSQSIYDCFYEYDDTKSDKADTVIFEQLTIYAPSDSHATLERSIATGCAVGRAVNLAKTLAALPGNICTPTYLAKQAQALQKQYAIATKVLDEARMKRLKMGSLLSVSMGSREPAKLIVMEYKGGKTDESPVALVGKGLTFDAGGISLKPSPGMDEMKYDMCGGASVIATLQAVAEMELPINVVGIVAASENLPDGAANKPGDVVTSMSGKTIEILNTDAEGRLILCDALTYAGRFKPSVVIDIATLTGACVVALGDQASGLFSNDDSLAEQLLNAGSNSDDRAWRMPLWEEYHQQLKSNFADLANIGGKGAGAITAARFLSSFTEDYRWAHLDIAGTAWVSGRGKGPTGRPVPLLVDFLMHYQADSTSK